MATFALFASTDPQPTSPLRDALRQTALFEHIFNVSTLHGLFSKSSQQPCHILFHDMQHPLPGAGNWRLLLDEHPQTLHLPVFALAQHENLTRKVAALESGANDCFAIDGAAEELAARIRLQLRNYKRLCELRQAKQQLAHQALTDPLTGLYNRGYFDATLITELARSQRNGRSFSLMLLDLDHFKAINDQHGHPFGDTVLRLVAQTLSSSLRSSDILCRFGGEEFAAILAETPVPYAYILGRRLHNRITKTGQLLPELNKELTVSIGISNVKKPGITAMELLAQADKALYLAKDKGRNRTEIFNNPLALLNFIDLGSTAQPAEG